MRRWEKGEINLREVDRGAPPAQTNLVTVRNLPFPGGGALLVAL